MLADALSDDTQEAKFTAGAEFARMELPLFDPHTEGTEGGDNSASRYFDIDDDGRIDFTDVIPDVPITYIEAIANDHDEYSPC